VKSLEYVYGIDIMIIAFAQLIRMTNIPLKLFIYGSGSQEVELKSLIRNLGLDEFIYLKGVINNDDVPNVLNSFDIFFALSRSESFGVSVLEALSCGLPVVCSKAPGFVELITNRENGILVDIDNISDIVEKILELISSRGLREELGMNGINFVQNNYSHLLFRDNILNFYNKQISN
jgi:glycosyltransferase involved in cell wall biosynthesis